MTGQIEPEVDARPRRSWGGGGPLLVVLLVLAAALALGSAWWFGAPGKDPVAEGPEQIPATGPSASTVESPSAPEGSRSAAPRSSPSLPPISGTKVDAVAAGWAKWWHTPPKAVARGYDTTTVLPGTNYNIRFGVIKSTARGGTEVATVFCITTGQRITVDQRLIRAVLDSCLAPALRGEEKAMLSTWLTAQDYSRDVYANRELPRFNAEVVSAGTAFQVRLYSRGRSSGPGATSTTGAQPAG